MKRSELEKIISGLNLEYAIENNGNLIMQVWQKYSDTGFKIESKYYSASVLGEKEVTTLNSNFKELLKTLDENNIQIISAHNIENGVISTWVLGLRDEPLDNKDRNLDFEIQTRLKTVRNTVNYSDALPQNVGYGYQNSRISPRFGGEKLRKHEMEMVVGNIDELFVAASNNASWIVEFSVSQNSSEPVRLAVEKGIITTNDAVSSIFDHDEVYYDRQREYATVLKYLTTLKVDNLDIANKTIRGSLPDIIVNSASLYQNVLKNWEFEFNTGQKILTMLIYNKQLKQFKQFINTKNPKKYKFQDWHGLIEPLLLAVCSDDEVFLKYLIKLNWLDISTVKAEYIIDFLVDEFNQFGTSSYLLLLTEFMSLHPSSQSKLLASLFNTFDETDFHDSFLTREIINTFIKNTTINDISSYMINDAVIMYYLPDGHQLKNKLLSDDNFLKYLTSVDKLEYMPEAVKDVFLF